MISWNFNFLEPSGPLQACNGTAVPLLLPPSHAVVMKSGNLNFLEPSGPLQACNGTTVPLLLPPSCAVVMKSGNLNFLEPSGPLQACNGTALPFFFSDKYQMIRFLWHMTPCRMEDRNGCFGGACCFHLQGGKSEPKQTLRDVRKTAVLLSQYLHIMVLLLLTFEYSQICTKLKPSLLK
jgi:hypothetical protein